MEVRERQHGAVIQTEPPLLQGLHGPVILRQDIIVPTSWMTKPRLCVATELAQRHAARELALESRSVQTPFTTPNRLNTSGLSCFNRGMGSEPLSHVWRRRWGRTETLARRRATQRTVP